MTFSGSPDDDLPPVDVVVPDDARELDDDLDAYYREVRQHARRAWWRRNAVGRWWARATASRWWARFGSTAPFVVAALVVVGVAGGILALLGPRTPARPSAADLADHPTATSGAVGGLVPDARLRTGAGSRTARSLRPAVLALVQPRCRCGKVLESVYRQASEYHLQMWLVATRQGRRSVRQVSGDAGLGAAPVVTDGDARLFRAFVAPRPAGDSSLVFVLVHSDGVVREILTDVRPSDRLELHLAPLTGPGAPG